MRNGLCPPSEIMGNFYLYIFNFDGVLADSQRLYVNAINRALTSAGFPDLAVEPARLTSLESLDPVALAHALDVPEERHFRFCQAYLQHLESHASRCQLVPGAAQLLSTLSALAYTVLLTRSRSQLTESILLVNGLRQHVHRLVGAEQRGDLTSKIHRLLGRVSHPGATCRICRRSARRFACRSASWRRLAWLHLGLGRRAGCQLRPRFVGRAARPVDGTTLWRTCTPTGRHALTTVIDTSHTTENAFLRALH